MPLDTRSHEEAIRVSYPYLGDFLRTGLGVNVPLPVPMFGIFVALSVALAARVFALNIQRAEAFARLPAGSHRVGIGMLIFVLPQERRWLRWGIPLALVTLLSACVAV